MSSVRRHIVAVAVLSGLALTACQPAEDDSAGVTDRPTAGATPSGASTASPDKGGSAGGGEPGDGATSSPAADKGSGSGGDALPCGTADVKFSANLAEPTTSSYLLKVTNRGSKPCLALGHPVVTFGDLDGQATARGAAPRIEDALRLGPGESAYAGLMGGTDDGTGRTVHFVELTMTTDSDLEQTPLKAPTPGLYVSPDENSVTPWVGNAEDALSL